MHTYEVCLTVEGFYWTEVVAESEAEAEEYARDTLYLGDIQSVRVTEADVKLCANGPK